MDLSKVTVKTPRLLLAPIAMDYVKDMFVEFTLEITRYMVPKSPEKISEIEAFVTESLAGLRQGTNLQMVILDKATQEFMGCAGLHDLDSQSPELGVWLKQSAHGQGFGFEAMAALKKWADEHLSYRVLVYPVDEANIPSRRIPEKLGGTIIRQQVEKSLSGRDLHILTYEIPRG
jgi:[ribosomal protein S5]-alanine N-acetyltransferase